VLLLSARIAAAFFVGVLLMGCYAFACHVMDSATKQSR
jgi:hypothetical protein